MRRFFKIAFFAWLLVSGGYAVYELRQVAQVKKDLDAGLAPEAALQKLVDSDKTGIVGKVVDAHKAQMTRLGGLGDLQSAAESAAEGDPDAARRLSAAVAAMSGAALSGGEGRPGQASAPAAAPGAAAPRKAVPLAPSTITVLAAGEEVEAGPGVAVLVDEKTGERIVLRSSRKVSRRSAPRAAGGKSMMDRIPGLPSIPKEVSDALGLPAPGSVQWRKWRAYGLLFGTLLGTIVMVLWARRRFG